MATLSANMSNSGTEPLRVPGFCHEDNAAAIPLDYQIPVGARFAHGIAEWAQRPTVTAREAAMVAVMERITDLPGWATEILADDPAAAVRRWREDVFPAVAGPGFGTVGVPTIALMSHVGMKLEQGELVVGDRVWDWIGREMRDKAREMQENGGWVRVLDTGSCVWKGDGERVLGAGFMEEVRKGLEPVYGEASRKKEEEDERRAAAVVLEQSRTCGEEVIVVDPSMYPLVYGKTPVLRQGGRVDISDLYGAFPRARPVPEQHDLRIRSDWLQSAVDRGALRLWSRAARVHNDPRKLRQAFWSSRFQQLPCEVKFAGQADSTDVQITSYVNNLHPRHRAVYRCLERLISRVIFPWNQCLIRGRYDWDLPVTDEADRDNERQRGSVPLRIVTYGAEYSNELPEWVMAFDNPSTPAVKKIHESKTKIILSAEDREMRRKAMEGRSVWQNQPAEMPELTSEVLRKAEELLDLPEGELQPPDPSAPGWRSWHRDILRRVEEKIDGIQCWRHPEPGVVVSYDDWKCGEENHRPVVDAARTRFRRQGRIEGHFPTDARHTSDVVQLEQQFCQQGLQVIVKIGGIELNSSQTACKSEKWQMPGMLNEHIVATAIYVYDVSNVTECRMEFRQPNSMKRRCYRYGRNAGQNANNPGPRIPGFEPVHYPFASIAGVFGYDTDELLEQTNPSRDEFPMQDLGSVSLPNGRLITFPNVMEYRYQPFQLVDPTEPGHHRYIAIYLVDPHYRICSTRNVPPQQLNWWPAPVCALLMRKGLPREIVDEIVRYCGWTTDAKTAASYKEAMVREHDWMTVARYRMLEPRKF